MNIVKLAAAAATSFALLGAANAESLPGNTQSQCMLDAAADAIPDTQTGYEDSYGENGTKVVKRHVVKDIDGITITMKDGVITMDAFYQASRVVLSGGAYDVSHLKTAKVNVEKDPELATALNERALLAHETYARCMNQAPSERGLSAELQ